MYKIINLHKTVDITAKISYNKRGNWEMRKVIYNFNFESKVY